MGLDFSKLNTRLRNLGIVLTGKRPKELALFVHVVLITRVTCLELCIKKIHLMFIWKMSLEEKKLQSLCPCEVIFSL